MAVKLNVANLLIIVVVSALVVTALLISGTGQNRECEKGLPGDIFIDCVNPEWQGISSWEARYDNNTAYVNLQGDNSDLVRWQVIDADDTKRGRIIDVQYSDVPANGRLRFHTARFGNFADMTAFAGGTVSFDVRVLRWGRAERALTVNFTCGYPCNTGPITLELEPHNEWQTVLIAVDDLVTRGLYLRKVDIGLAISPAWNGMQGFHFQIDNVRWIKAPRE